MGNGGGGGGGWEEWKVIGEGGGRRVCFTKDVTTIG